MTTSPTAPASPVPSPTLVAQAAGLLIGVTAVVFGSVLALGLTVPLIRSHIVTALAVAVPVLGLLALVVERWILGRHRVTWSALGFTRPTRRLLHLLWQIPVVLIALLAVQGVALLLLGGNGVSTDSSSSGVDGLDPASAVLLFLGTAVVTPLWEEIFFRGILFGAVRARWGTAWAVLISAVVFAAAHGVPILLPYLVTLGLALALLRAVHRTLWASLALHVTVNVIASSALLVALM